MAKRGKPCKTCMYSSKLSGNIVYCNYMELTGHMRGVPSSKCISLGIYKPKLDWQYGLHDIGKMNQAKRELKARLQKEGPPEVILSGEDEAYDPRKDPAVLKLLEGNEEEAL